MFIAVKAIEHFPLTYAVCYKCNNSSIWCSPCHHVKSLHHVLQHTCQDHMMCTMNDGIL